VVDVGFAGPRWIIQLVSVVVATVVGGSGHVAPAPGSDLGPPPRRGPTLTVLASTPWSAEISWSAVKGANRYRIIRDGRLIDDFTANSDSTYQDHLLWPSSTYVYELKAIGPGGVLADLLGSVTTPAQTGSLPRFYADTSFWNTPIPASPSIDPDSGPMVSTSLSAYASLGVINSGDDWGIPLAYADAHSKMYTVECLLFGCETTVRFRIPRYATPNTGSDGHLAVYDPTIDQELDLWQGSYDPVTRTWSASGRTATDAGWGAACPEGTRCGGGGTAAGFLEFGGVIRPEEIAQGHIDHALVLSSPYLRADYIACPATNYWASDAPNYKRDSSAIPLGARVQLDPNIDVDAKPWPQWEKIVAHALQTYGAYIADVSGSLELRGEANLDRGYDAWANVGMTTLPKPDLSNLPWKRFRVLTMASC
jgi:hypothetical protein